MRRPLTFLSLLFLAAGCGGGGGGATTVECEPRCPVGQTCTENGCVLDAPGGASDLAVEATGDLAGACSPACSGATPFCSARGLCVRCLADGDCPAGQVCAAVGLTTTCVPGCTDDARCGGGTARCCAGRCTDTAKDAANCGACAMSCGAQHSSAACEGGLCVAGACHRGYGNCNGDPADGCEQRLDADAEHCGGCGKRCSIKNAIAGCAGASDDNPTGCYLRGCQFGFDDCNGDGNDGCETVVTADTRNCGACGNVCTSVPNARVGCITGLCALTGCNIGFSDCDRNSKNGCEVATGSDKNNCGACGAACGQGQVCVNGACTCQQCNIPNAKTKCVNNMCVFDSCAQGFADCDFNINNGCEVDLQNDAKNCNACGNACKVGEDCYEAKCGIARGCSQTAKYTFEVVKGVWACATDHVIMSYMENDALCNTGFTPATFKLVQGLPFPDLAQHQAYSQWYQLNARNNGGYIRTGQKRRGGCVPDAHGDVYIANGDNGWSSQTGGWRDLYNGGASCNNQTDAANNMGHPLAGVICVRGVYELPKP